MAHPQHNFTSNFNGSDGHNAELTLNINGVEKKYTPAGNDQTYNVPGVARIDINLDGADLVQAIQTALDGAAQPVLVERSIYDEEYVYQYIGDFDGAWYFGTCTTNKIVTIAVAKEDGAVNGEQIPVANGVVIVPSDGLNVYSQLRTAIALGQLPVLSYVGANPVYAQYEKTADNGDLIFVGALATASDTYVQYNIYTVSDNDTVTVTTRAASAGGGGTPDDENGFFNSSLYQTPGDGVTESLTLNDFRIKQGTSIHGSNIEFVATHQEGGIDFGEVWLNPGTYILNIRYTLQWVGNPRGTFTSLVCNVGGQPFDFSFEQENTLITSQIRVVTARQKVSMAFPFDADTPPMGIWVETLSIAQIASNTHPAVVHDTTLAGSGTAGSPLGVTTDAFGKIKDIPTSISQFRAGDVIPVDGPNGPAKMSKDDLLTETAQNALAGNVAPAFDPNRDVDHGYPVGYAVSYQGKTYVFNTYHYGPWLGWDADKILIQDLSNSVGGVSFRITGSGNTIVASRFKAVANTSIRIIPKQQTWDISGVGSGTNIFFIRFRKANGSYGSLASESGLPIKRLYEVTVPSDAIWLEVAIRATSGTNVAFDVSACPVWPSKQYANGDLLELGAISMSENSLTYYLHGGRTRTLADKLIKVSAGDIIGVDDGFLLNVAFTSSGTAPFSISGFTKFYIAENDGFVAFEVRADGASTYEQRVNAVYIYSKSSQLNPIPYLLDAVDSTNLCVSRTLVGANTYVVTWQFNAPKNSICRLILSKTDWSINSIGTGVYKFIVRAVLADGSTRDISRFADTNVVPKLLDVVVPDDSVALDIFLRCDATDSVTIEAQYIGQYGLSINARDEFFKSINHRGYTAIAPENTLPAYRLSAKMGFSAVETDVRLTSDGVLVCLHDATVDRTSNGSGLVVNKTLAELKTLDFGSWRSAEYAGTKIPTYEEFLICCRNLGMEAYVEIKDASGHYEDLINIAKRVGMKGKVSFVSFSLIDLQAISNIDASVRVGLIVDDLNASAVSDVTSLNNPNAFIHTGNLATATDAAIDLARAANIAVEVSVINNIDSLSNLNGYISAVSSDVLIASKFIYSFELNKS